MEAIDPEALYDERGDVSRGRPLLQGDVFDGIVLPGFGDEPRMVQIVNHPCAMRKGPTLLPRITVAPVEPHSQIQGETGWNGNLRVMPLPDLRSGRHFAAKFVDVTAAPAELLALDRRIASLSSRGIYVLQQRLIKHYTRFEIGLELLRRESAPVLEEAQSQWTWLETVLTDEELQSQEAIDAEVAVFDQWLGEGSPSRRERLKEEVNHSDIRREVMREASLRESDRHA